jgi:hypothetical protein
VPSLYGTPSVFLEQRVVWDRETPVFLMLFIGANIWWHWLQGKGEIWCALWKYKYANEIHF